MGDSAAHLVAPLVSNQNVVFCRGLSFKATEADVRSMLADCGDILSVGMPVDARARPSGIANVEFGSSDACARAIAKAAAGITHMGRYIEIMPRGQRNDSWPSVAHPPDTVSASASEMTVSSSGLARILAAQPKKPVIRNRTPLRDDGSGDPANTASNSTRGPSASRQRTITPRRGQSDGQAPWRDPKNAGTPCTHRMPIDVACRICIGAELSGKLSPLEDYEQEIAWIEHDLESANERFKCCQKALACLTQDKALLDEQVSEEIKTRIQRSEERKSQIEVLKTAKFNCRQLMFEISRSMPAAALQGDARRLCTQSDLKAQIKKLQEVSEQDPESIVDKPDVHAKPDISINGIRKVWGQSRLILETEKRVSDYIGRLSAAARALDESESALSIDAKGQRSITPSRAQLSGEIRDCVSKRNAARNEIEVLGQMLNIVQKERKRSVRRHDFVVQQHDVAMDFGGLCRSIASCGWHFCTLPAGHQGRCEICPLECVIYCGCRESTLNVQCGRENELVACSKCDKYSSAPSQRMPSLVSQHPLQPSASDWVMPGTEWGVQDSASGFDIHVAVVSDPQNDWNVDTGVLPAFVPDRLEPVTVPPDLDVSFDADRALRKRQLSAANITAVKKSVPRAVKTTNVAPDAYDGPIYKPKILSHEAMMARVHDLLKAEELSAASKFEEQLGKPPSKPKEPRRRAVSRQTKSDSDKSSQITTSIRSRSTTPAADSSNKCEALSPMPQRQKQQQQQQQQQQDHHQLALKQNQQSLHSTPVSSSDSADELVLQEDVIRRRILEVKKQKKATTAWSAISSPFAVAAFFTIVVGVILCLFLVPEDSRFFNGNGQRERSSERLDSDSYERGDSQEQQETNQQQQWQRHDFEKNQQMNADDDDESDWKTVQHDDNFYKNSGSGTDDADDDYAPWNEKPTQHAEPAYTRTHRVVQQRMVPPQAGERFRV